MRFTFLHPFKLKLPDEHTAIIVYAAQHDASEGGEFLDDALRTEDLALTPAEESIAAGSPANLM